MRKNGGGLNTQLEISNAGRSLKKKKNQSFLLKDRGIVSDSFNAELTW